MSLAVGLVVAAGGVAVGRWLAKSMGSQRKPGQPDPVESAPAPSGDATAGLPCHLGDVVVRTAEHDEAWLAAAIVFEEQGPIGALFVAPEAGVDRAIFAREGTDTILWLTALGEQAALAGGEPPSTFEHGGVRYERVRRLPVRAVRRGAGAPAVGDRAIVAEYDAPNDAHVLIVAGTERALAWAGVALEKNDYDVLPGGKATLE